MHGWIGCAIGGDDCDPYYVVKRVGVVVLLVVCDC